MNESLIDSTATARKTAYVVLIVVACGAMTGRILTVSTTIGSGRDPIVTPLLSANDRSRWATIRALVDHNTYAIDEVIQVKEVRPNGVEVADREWNSIDKVKRKGKDGEWQYYSSKPTLLPTLVAGQYWLIKNATGARFDVESRKLRAFYTFYIVRIILILTNVLPLAIAFVLLARMVDRFGTTDWGRIFVVACATFGTMLTTFAVTLNNHIPAAVSATIAIYCVLRIWCDDRRDWWLFALGGLFAAFAAANELPALSLLAVCGLAALLKCPRRALLLFTPGALIVAGAFFGINYHAHESLRPPYMHWGDGPLVKDVKEIDLAAIDQYRISPKLRQVLENEDVYLSEATVVEVVQPGKEWRLNDPRQMLSFVASIREMQAPEDQSIAKEDVVVVELIPSSRPDQKERAAILETDHTWLFNQGLLTASDRSALSDAGLKLSVDTQVGLRDAGERWALFDPESKDKYSLVVSAEKLRAHDWDNWYDFEGSYWSGDRQGVDQGEPSKARYLFHTLIGHHGVFSLTPMWILAVVGICLLAGQRKNELFWFALAVAALSLAVIFFYTMTRPQHQRNYGGVACGLRWLFWLAPLWIVMMISAADRLAKYVSARVVALLLLLASAVSAGYASTNPWTDPWIYRYQVQYQNAVEAEQGVAN
jgi:hypothetical protein